ncbi:hypothetical protein ACJJTC_003836 [Scirpophaga incertulas]
MPCFFPFSVGKFRQCLRDLQYDLNITDFSRTHPAADSRRQRSAKNKATKVYSIQRRNIVRRPKVRRRRTDHSERSRVFLIDPASCRGGVTPYDLTETIRGTDVANDADRTRLRDDTEAMRGARYGRRDRRPSQSKRFRSQHSKQSI